MRKLLNPAISLSQNSPKPLLLAVALTFTLPASPHPAAVASCPEVAAYSLRMHPLMLLSVHCLEGRLSFELSCPCICNTES